MENESLRKIAEDAFLLAHNIREGDLEEELEPDDDDLAIRAKREWRAMELVIGLGERLCRATGITDPWVPDGIRDLIDESLTGAAHTSPSTTKTETRTRIALGDGHSFIIGHNGTWQATNTSLVPMALSNYSPNAAALKFALQDAGDDTEAALAAVQKHCYRQYGTEARLVSSDTSAHTSGTQK